MGTKALLVGNSDGIGLAATRKLLKEGWQICGISRSESPIANGSYYHYKEDVSAGTYPDLIDKRVREGSLDLCIYFAGIGELLNLKDMRGEPHIFDVNLTGMVRTAAGVIPSMVERGRGHFIGISSLGDELLSAEAPSYHASKTGFSNYLRSLALALKPEGVHITTLRFGFVDTKMAKGDVKPFMMSVERAVDHLEVCIRKKPVCYTAPKIMVPLIKFRKLMMRLGGT